MSGNRVSVVLRQGAQVATGDAVEITRAHVFGKIRLVGVPAAAGAMRADRVIPAVVASRTAESTLTGWAVRGGRTPGALRRPTTRRLATGRLATGRAPTTSLTIAMALAAGTERLRARPVIPTRAGGAGVGTLTATGAEGTRVGTLIPTRTERTRIRTVLAAPTERARIRALVPMRSATVRARPITGARAERVTGRSRSSPRPHPLVTGTVCAPAISAGPTTILPSAVRTGAIPSAGGGAIRLTTAPTLVTTTIAALSATGTASRCTTIRGSTRTPAPGRRTLSARRATVAGISLAIGSLATGFASATSVLVFVAQQNLLAQRRKKGRPPAPRRRGDLPQF